MSHSIRNQMIFFIAWKSRHTVTKADCLTQIVTERDINWCDCQKKRHIWPHGVTQLLRCLQIFGTECCDVTWQNSTEIHSAEPGRQPSSERNVRISSLPPSQSQSVPAARAQPGLLDITASLKLANSEGKNILRKILFDWIFKICDNPINC